MRSRLEAYYAAALESAGVEWTYEPECFASLAGQYLPDFRIGDGWPCWYVEVKPFVDDATTLQKQMAIIWESEPDVALVILADNGAWRGLAGEWVEDDFASLITRWAAVAA